MRRFLVAALLTAVVPLVQAAEDGVLLPAAAPPDAAAGECYAMVFSPPQYRAETERVVKRPARTETRTIPAVYEYVPEQRQIPPHEKTIIVEPAVYETYEEDVLVRPAGEITVTVEPARYRTVTERVPVESGNLLKPNTGINGAICMTEAPIAYRIEKRRQLVSPAVRERRQVDAQYKPVKRRKLVRPAVTRTVQVPASVETVRIRKLVEPARQETVELPAEYGEVTRQVLSRQGEMHLRAVLCANNTSPGFVTGLQRALKARGFDPGPVDGVYGRRTAEALEQFQTAQGWATRGVTRQAAEALGLKLVARAR